MERALPTRRRVQLAQPHWHESHFGRYGDIASKRRAQIPSITGEKLRTLFQSPLISIEDAYPYLTGLHGSIALGNFEFYVVYPDGGLSHFKQGFVTTAAKQINSTASGKDPKRVIVMPVEDEHTIKPN